MRKDLDNNKRMVKARGRIRERVRDGKDSILPKQVIFSSDTTYIYFNIHIYMNKKNIIIYIHHNALRITKLASDIYDVLRE